MQDSSRKSAHGTVGWTLLILLSASVARADSTPSTHSTTAAQPGLPTATPESQGVSSAGLNALSSEMHALVDQQKLAGVTTLVARHGKVVHLDTYGKANVATGEALQADSIFRIASMTKPIAGVAMMQLYEQGKWKLDDPVAKYIPEFANLQVKKAGGGTEPQKSPMTMAQLMSHSAGFGVSAVYTKARPLAATDLQGMIDKLKNAAARNAAGHGLGLRPERQHPGLRRRKALGSIARCVLRRAHLQAARHDRYRLLGSSGEGEPRRRRPHV